MDDSQDSDPFDFLIEKSFVLESLKDTMNQMLEGYYIRKDTSDKIIKEASKQFRKVLTENKFFLPKLYVFGHLIQYNYFNETWNFNLLNPLIYIYSSSHDQQDYSSLNSEKDTYLKILDLDISNEYTSRSGSNPSKDVSRYLNKSNSNMHCFKGYLRIMAVTDSEE